MYCPKCDADRDYNQTEKGLCLGCKTPCLDVSKEDAQTAIKIIEDLTHMVNSLSLSGDIQKIMATKLVRSHRTLQQSTMRLLYGLITEYSKLLKEWGTDPRNENAKIFADRVAEMKVYFSLI